MWFCKLFAILFLGFVISSDALSVWPKPLKQVNDNGFLVLSQDFYFKSNADSCDIVQSAFKRYHHMIFGSYHNLFKKHHKSHFEEDAGSHGFLSYLSVDIESLDDCKGYPQENSDESYQLTIKDTESQLKSKTVWGFLRGIETFSQLIDDDFVINGTTINDKPRFAFRGLLVDTSRHFIPIPILLKNIELMSQNKMNVLHWHIVDDPSFPFFSKAFPNMTTYGAYKPVENHIYTESDVQLVVDFARKRGVRVMPEFDTPGHTLSWGKSMPHLLTDCYDSKTGKPTGTKGNFDPTDPQMWQFLKTFFQDVFERFPEKYVHLGGDEVNFDVCWKQNPKIAKFMVDHKLKTYAELETFYFQNLLSTLNTTKKSGRATDSSASYVVWQEVFDNNVVIPKETIINVWKSRPFDKEMARVTKAGYRAILSACWYLNLISYGTDWHRYYKCDPQDFKAETKAQYDLVVGGEACMWGEYVDATNVISRTWPRSSVVAERLWSSKDTVDIGDATTRLHSWRCRLLRRGFQVEPIEISHSCPFEWGSEGVNPIDYMYF